MNNVRRIFLIVGSLFLVLFGYVHVSGQDQDVAAPEASLATLHAGTEGLQWQPNVPYEALVLTVTGPDGFYWQAEYASGEMPTMAIITEDGKLLADGSYSYELLMIPALSAEAEAALAAVDPTDVEARTAVKQDLQEKGLLPSEPLVQTGSFSVDALAFSAGALNLDTVAGNDRDPVMGMDGLEMPLDQSILDDLIVTGSTCIGFDCVNGESFGFDTLRLKENNLRLHFNDTSTSASFPSNDWRIIINDSANGGANYFAVEDATAGNVPFRIVAGAGSNALYVDAQGDVGLNTTSPVTELHINDGDTPTVRFEQNGSFGWSPQTWDVAGNETNFFIRDVTNGSKLPFRIRPNAPNSSLYIDSSGNTGFNDTSPDASLDVYRTNGTAQILVEEGSGTTAGRVMLDLVNNGAARIRMTNSSTGESWLLSTDGNGDFIISLVGSGGPEFSVGKDGSIKMGASGTQNFYMDANGNVTIQGSLTTANGTVSMPTVSTPQDVRAMEGQIAAQQAEIDALSQENAEMAARLAEVEQLLQELSAMIDE